MFLHSQRLNNVQLPHVSGLSGVHVDSEPFVSRSVVLSSEINHYVDGIYSCVLSDGNGYRFQSVREGSDRELLPPTSFGREIFQSLGKLRFGGASARDYLAILKRIPDYAKRVV